jgi:hypothetical protein
MESQLSQLKSIPWASRWVRTAITHMRYGLLKIMKGLYGDSGTETCSGYPGSQGYETTDAHTLASWGVDLWKYDNVLSPSFYFLTNSY